MDALSVTCLKLLEPLFSQEEAGLARLLNAWSTLIGDPFCTSSLPEKWVALPNQAAVLHLRVWNGLAFEMSHSHDRWRDRINQFFGYKAIDRLVFRQSGSQTACANQQKSPPSASASLDALFSVLRQTYPQFHPEAPTLSDPAGTNFSLSSDVSQDSQSLFHADVFKPNTQDTASMNQKDDLILPQKHIPDHLLLALNRLGSALEKPANAC